MHDSLPSKSYRSLLAELNGKGFSESAVQDILKQILPQLLQIHSSRKAHGCISLDTIAQINNMVELSPSSAPQFANSAVMIKDISDLGQVLAELLTGKIGIQGNIDDYCTASDQTLELVNAMMRNSVTRQFKTVVDVFALNPNYNATIDNVVSYSSIPINSEYNLTQNESKLVEKEPQKKIVIIALGLFCLMLIFVVINNSLKNPRRVISSSSTAETSMDPAGFVDANTYTAKNSAYNNLTTKQKERGCIVYIDAINSLWYRCEDGNNINEISLNCPDSSGYHSVEGLICADRNKAEEIEKRTLAIRNNSGSSPVRPK